MRAHGLAFRRQSPIGNYIIDFECRPAKLCIELDGAQHGMTSALEYDQQRTEWLNTQGYEVLRFWNHDVLRHTDVIVDQIVETAKRRRQHADGGGSASICRLSRSPLSHRALHADSSPLRGSTDVQQ